MEKRRRDRRIGAWLAVALWTALILTLAGDAFSTSSTGGVLGPLLRWLFPGIEPDSIRVIHEFTRKGAHAFEYGVLALLTFRALRIGPPRHPARSAALAMAFLLAVGAADETRQARSEERTGSTADLALDGASGAAALGLAALVLAVRRRRRGEPDEALACAAPSVRKLP